MVYMKFAKLAPGWMYEGNWVGFSAQSGEVGVDEKLI